MQPLCKYVALPRTAVDEALMRKMKVGETIECHCTGKNCGQAYLPGIEEALDRTTSVLKDERNCIKNDLRKQIKVPPSVPQPGHSQPPHIPQQPPLPPGFPQPSQAPQQPKTPPKQPPLPPGFPQTPQPPRQPPTTTWVSTTHTTA
ncbi:hypothetical protein OSTOST_09778 [Ostertagia ostertagi]